MDWELKPSLDLCCFDNLSQEQCTIRHELYSISLLCISGNAVVANSNVTQEIKDILNQLVQRWNDIPGAILERQRALKAASHHYGEFKGNSHNYGDCWCIGLGHWH